MYGRGKEEVDSRLDIDESGKHLISISSMFTSRYCNKMNIHSVSTDSLND